MRKAISLFLAICLLTFTACSSSQPTDEELVEKSVKQFIHAFNQGSADEMLSCFSSAERERLAGQNIAEVLWVAIALGLGVENVGDTAQLTDITVSVYKAGFANAYANLSYTGDSGDYSGHVLFELIEENGSWLVQNYECIE